MATPTRSLQFNREQGTLKLGPLRYILLRPETLSEIQKGVEDRLGSKAAEYLYAAGASWAVGALRRLKSALPDDPDELAKALCLHATELGWGKLELTSLNLEERKLAVRLTGSPFSAAYGQSDKPVCHVVAGAIGGLAEALFKMPTACTEEMCMAQDNPSCLFVAIGHDVAGKDAWEW
jgi:predicted hydrocarbon binding protein